MKPFDLTQPVETRDGRKARVVDTNFLGNGYGRTILAVITGAHGESARTYRPGGQSDEGQSPDDLVNIRKEHTRNFWVNCYADFAGDAHHLTRRQADGGTMGNRIACVKVSYTFKEGDGL